MTNTVCSGSVKWFSAEKGYGFLQAEGIDKDVFLHVKQLRSSGIMGSLADGEQVRFVCNTGPKGLFATQVTRTNGAQHAGANATNQV